MIGSAHEFEQPGKNLGLLCAAATGQLYAVEGTEAGNPPQMVGVYEDCLNP